MVHDGGAFSLACSNHPSCTLSLIPPSFHPLPSPFTVHIGGPVMFTSRTNLFRAGSVLPFFVVVVAIFSFLCCPLCCLFASPSFDSRCRIAPSSSSSSCSLHVKHRIGGGGLVMGIEALFYTHFLLQFHQPPSPYHHGQWVVVVDGIETMR